MRRWGYWGILKKSHFQVTILYIRNHSLKVLLNANPFLNHKK